MANIRCGLHDIYSHTYEGLRCTCKKSFLIILAIMRKNDQSKTLNFRNNRYPTLLKITLNKAPEYRKVKKIRHWVLVDECITRSEGMLLKYVHCSNAFYCSFVLDFEVHVCIHEWM